MKPKTSVAEKKMVQLNNLAIKRASHFRRTLSDGKYLLILAIPTVLCLLAFAYLPMWGIIIAFKQYAPFVGVMDSPWVGMKHFIAFFENPFAFMYIKNTFLLSLYSLLWGFPAPILLALVLNEVSNLKLKKIVQTVSYMPHFYSTVVVASLFTMFLSPSTGPVSQLLKNLGIEPIDYLSNAKYFRTVYIASEIWQNIGWGTIIYLAALTSIDPMLYEASTIDGANKFDKLIYITLPTIAPTIVTMLLLSMGQLMSVGFERVFLFQKPSTMSVADTISTYVYRVGLKQNSFSYATAVGLFNSVINVILLVLANQTSKKFSETSLW